jgi:hypothetical protein
MTFDATADCATFLLERIPSTVVHRTTPPIQRAVGGKERQAQELVLAIPIGGPVERVPRAVGFSTSFLDRTGCRGSAAIFQASEYTISVAQLW